ncbi:MAG: rhodanese-like domain-containing protein [Flavobacteriales bacterium]
MKLISPKDMYTAQEAQKDVLLVDIREPYEYQNCQIEALRIPMADFANQYPSIAAHQMIVLMCQSGKRAEALVNFMDTEFKASNVYLLEGGLNAWITEIDPQLSCE